MPEKHTNFHHILWKIVKSVSNATKFSLLAMNFIESPLPSFFQLLRALQEHNTLGISYSPWAVSWLLDSKVGHTLIVTLVLARQKPGQIIKSNYVNYLILIRFQFSLKSEFFSLPRLSLLLDIIQYAKYSFDI